MRNVSAGGKNPEDRVLIGVHCLSEVFISGSHSTKKVFRHRDSVAVWSGAWATPPSPSMAYQSIQSFHQMEYLLFGVMPAYMLGR